MDKTGNFELTTGWMQEKFDEFNAAYFGGRLMECQFSTFSTGKGSQGRTLGRFSLKNCGYNSVDRRRKLYHFGYLPGEVSIQKWGRPCIEITRENFVRICQPMISLNANYTWNEISAQLVLIHEMCHYAVYVSNGYCREARSHGARFMAFARQVDSLSEGKYTVNKVATSETMDNVELNGEIAEKNKQRRQSRINNSVIVLMKSLDYGHMMFMAKEGIAQQFINLHNAPCPKYPMVKIIRDQEIVEEVVNKGYKLFIKPTRYYLMEKWPNVLDMLLKADGEVTQCLSAKRNENKITDTLNMIIESELNKFKEELGMGGDDGDIVMLDRSVNLGTEDAI